MHFLRPEASWLLFVLLIPLILYILPLPRKKRTIASTLLWRLVVDRRGLSARRSVARILAAIVLTVVILLLIIGAFGRVLIGGRDATHDDALVVLVVDNSASMQAPAGDVSRFETARQRAVAFLDTLPAGARMMLATTSPSPTVVVRETTEPAAVAESLRTMSVTDAPGRVADTLERLMRTFADVPIAVHLFSDDVAAGARFDVPVTPYQCGTSVANSGVVGFGARRVELPKPAVLVEARLGNFSNIEREAEIVLTHDGTDLEPKTVTLPADSVVTASWLLSEVAGATFAVEMTPHDAFVPDDRATATLPSREEKRVVVVAEKPPTHLLAALGADSSLRTFLMKPDAYRPGVPSDLTVFVGKPPAELGRENMLVILLDLTDTVGYESSGATPLPANHPLMRGITWHEGLMRGGWIPLIDCHEFDGRKVVRLPFNPETEPIARSRTMPILVRNITEYLAPREDNDRSETTGLVDADESDLRVREPWAEKLAQTAVFGLSPAFWWSGMIVLAVALLALEAVFYHRRILE